MCSTILSSHGCMPAFGPKEVWQELQQRERVSHLTEGTDVPLKRLLASVQIGTSKIP